MLYWTFDVLVFEHDGRILYYINVDIDSVLVLISRTRYYADI